jgi:hypothetical protein
VIHWLWIIGCKIVVPASYKVKLVGQACRSGAVFWVQYQFQFQPSSSSIQCWVESARLLDRYTYTTTTATTTTIDRVTGVIRRAREREKRDGEGGENEKSKRVRERSITTINYIRLRVVEC